MKEKLIQSNQLNEELDISISGDNTGILCTQSYGDDTVFIEFDKIDEFISLLQKVKQAINT